MKLTKKPSGQCFSTVKADHLNFTVGKTLYGVIVECSDAQIRGMKEAVGSELAMETIKGCQRFVGNF